MRAALTVDGKTPVTVVPVIGTVAPRTATGKFCRLLGPVSASVGSFLARPAPPRSIAGAAVPVILFVTTLLPVPEATATPAPPPSAIVLQGKLQFWSPTALS